MSGEEREFTAIHERNARVEANKAWEMSWTRRILIAAGTYLIVSFYLTFLGITDAFLHAAVPAGAYLISTFSLPLAKNIWLSNVYKKSHG